MKYLLDINVLLAFRYRIQSSHSKAVRWIQHVRSILTNRKPFATCSIIELGFIRIASSQATLAGTLTVAREDLQYLKASLDFEFIHDDLEGNQLPDWVTKSKQTTDGHLLELASRHGMHFATLDTGIPGALLIPDYGDPSYADTPSKIQESAPPAYGAAAFTERVRKVHVGDGYLPHGADGQPATARIHGDLPGRRGLSWRQSAHRR